MAERDYFRSKSLGLGKGKSFTVDGTVGATGAARVHNIIHGAGCDVFIETQADDDSWSSVKVGSLKNAGFSQQNSIEVNAHDGVRMKIKNTSGGAADFTVTGIEVRN